MTDPTQWEIKKIINVANELQWTGSTAASMGETIAAAFVLNKPEYLPAMYSDMVEAWERLGGEWQQHVMIVKENYMYLIDEEDTP